MPVIIPDYDPPHFPYLCVLHKDADLLVISKPSGLLSVPGKPEGHQDSVQSRAEAAFPGALLVHRLDRDTSGIIIMAMNRRAQASFGKQFERRRTQKTYIARVWGDLAASQNAQSGRVDLPLCVDWPNRPLHHVSHENGRPAQTDWRIIGGDAHSTLVELSPITGRSHQLRVHMRALGHPILGDDLYAHDEARNAAPRLLLHAQSLALHHPEDGQLITFTDPYTAQNGF